MSAVKKVHTGQNDSSQQIFKHVTTANVNNVKGMLAHWYESGRVLYWLR